MYIGAFNVITLLSLLLFYCSYFFKFSKAASSMHLCLISYIDLGNLFNNWLVLILLDVEEQQKDIVVVEQKYIIC